MMKRKYAEVYINKLMSTNNPRPKALLIFLLAAALSIALAGCGAGGNDEIVLIDDMAQVDFDIDYPVGQITRDVTVTQSFVSNSDVITQLWLFGATYMRDNTATIEVALDLTDDSGVPVTSIARWTIDSSGMEDNSIIKLDVDPAGPDNHDLCGKSCLITITSPNGEPELSPTFWMTEEDVYPDGSLSINGYAQYNDLWFQVTGRRVSSD